MVLVAAMGTMVGIVIGTDIITVIGTNTGTAIMAGTVAVGVFPPFTVGIGFRVTPLKCKAAP